MGDNRFPRFTQPPPPDSVPGVYAHPGIVGQFNNGQGSPWSTTTTAAAAAPNANSGDGAMFGLSQNELVAGYDDVLAHRRLVLFLCISGLVLTYILYLIEEIGVTGVDQGAVGLVAIIVASALLFGAAAMVVMKHSRKLYTWSLGLGVVTLAINIPALINMWRIAVRCNGAVVQGGSVFAGLTTTPSSCVTNSSAIWVEAIIELMITVCAVVLIVTFAMGIANYELHHSSLKAAKQAKKPTKGD